MGLVYDTASAQVIQVVKIGCKSRYPTEIDKNVGINYSSYSRSTLFEPPYNWLKNWNLKDKIIIYYIHLIKIKFELN